MMLSVDNYQKVRCNIDNNFQTIDVKIHFIFYFVFCNTFKGIITNYNGHNN